MVEYDLVKKCEELEAAVRRELTRARVQIGRALQQTKEELISVINKSNET